ncbi:MULTISPECIES: hypothetical protein [unclassified Pseudomonas]|uniref:hypothetical protein n=1 Tax=unclassified Pseudomonas TaxID=196821 RepID=UPI00244A362C|nr:MULTISPECIES: hypothetical protein [unclassified Pseudomonas]MDG9925459.1 hypothetical protein [Pseudomonas sp. GD04045]MDH0034100.1 hypothetical protein [Pseudomonas sp. GD04019]
MSIEAISLEIWRERLRESLSDIRYAKDHDSATRSFYFFLGLVSAATSLDVISYHAMQRLHGLAMNASQYRSADQAAASDTEFAAAASAEQEAAA